MFDLSPGMQGFLGGAAAIGVPLLFNLGKEVIFDIRKRKAERAYISVQLIFLLDKFVARCADVAWDNGFDPMMPEPHDEELEDQTQIPVFDMISVKGEHKYLKPAMLARLHTIEIKLNQANESLHNEEAVWGWEGSLWKYYETRRELYGNVGLYAASIADDLRKEFGIKNVEGWKPSERIINSFENIKETRAQRAERKRLRKLERERKKAEEEKQNVESGLVMNE
ncbi:hypothetical protein PO467_20310 [Enterobacter kobei]|uniref:hypothetical protein n=1 Tax=Enterobacter kobei TaxID=208224 RepID=UPI00205F2131|nr:hypothetical protein [Enterobacter kobei]DAF38836.1 MAG TPA: hypothetical protein [Caudoviricetes sp.]HBV6848706.1 hypothetical protein [Klebsiella pneumoniae]ELC0997469.1 hypothetical protein [Enterobacter kobei]MCL5532312.1 hypothetical protein [Enterobacter kobei]HCM9730497.1 hypothetical protein [Enterobacter kobei]